jgi:hypothetical protein
MNMCLGHGHNPHPVSLGQIEINRDVTAGVDHNGLALALAADEVAGLRQVFVIDSLEQHIFSLRRFPRYPRGYVIDNNDNTLGGMLQVWIAVL